MWGSSPQAPLFLPIPFVGRLGVAHTIYTNGVGGTVRSASHISANGVCVKRRYAAIPLSFDICNF